MGGQSDLAPAILRWGLGITATAGSLLLLPFLTNAETIPGGGRARRSCLYLGNVWHSRFVPAVHNFWYSMFFTYLDLEEVEDGLLDKMWPLAASKGRTAIASFDERDHLKGYLEGTGLTLLERVRRLVEEKTGERPKGPICLLTHLRIMGYCFNPVSFYYCLDEAGERLETVVAEVSNTPWEEMHPYVLDARSEGVLVAAKGEGVVNYKFQKGFHVSPFMDMEHMYDWDFVMPRERVWVVTDMIKQGTRYFHAKFDLRRQELRPSQLARCLLRYPLFTWAVQFFIHVQAFKLWAKKVPFYPHPQGTETRASKAVATIMAPLWKLQEVLAKPTAQVQNGGNGAGAVEGEGAQAAAPEMTPEAAEVVAEEEEEESVEEEATATTTEGSTSGEVGKAGAEGGGAAAVTGDEAPATTGTTVAQ